MFYSTYDTLRLVVIALLVAAIAVAGCETKTKSAQEFKQEALKLVKQGKYKQSLKALLAAEKLTPDDDEIHPAKAGVFAKLGRTSECEASIIRAASLGDDPFTLFMDVGELLISNGKEKEGKAFLVKALKSGSNDATRMLMLANRLEELGLARESACAYLRLALLTVDSDSETKRRIVAMKLEEISGLFRWVVDRRAANATVVLGAQFLDEHSRNEGNYPTLPRSEIVKLATELLLRLQNIEEEELAGYRTSEQETTDLLEEALKGDPSFDPSAISREWIEKSFDETTARLEKEGNKEAAELNRRIKEEMLQEFDEQHKKKKQDSNK